MRISVIRFRGEAPAQSINFHFDARGGALGRHSANEIVLPDPELRISRVQARVEWRDGRFLLVDAGTNPSRFNGQPLAKGVEVPLAEGDEISIGDYDLRVDLAQQASVPGDRPMGPAPAGLTRFARRAARWGVAVRSWDDARPSDRPLPPVVDHRPARAAGSPAAPRWQGASQVPVMQTVPEVAAEPSGEASELLAAFLQGLGVSLSLPALTPELMERIGHLLREATLGAVKLSKARSETARELHSPVAMAAVKDSNPLMLAPDIGVALAQLLLPQVGASIRPEEALRATFEDLRAHQCALMAGMRATLPGVLGRLEPSAIEQRLAGRCLLDRCLPGSRKARLWDLFEQTHREVARQASADFAAACDGEFAKAHAEQLASLPVSPDAR